MHFQGWNMMTYRPLDVKLFFKKSGFVKAFRHRMRTSHTTWASFSLGLFGGNHYTRINRFLCTPSRSVVGWGLPRLWKREARREQLPSGSRREVSGALPGAVATPGWSRTSRKCCHEGGMLRKPSLLHLCPEYVGKHLRKQE